MSSSDELRVHASADALIEKEIFCYLLISSVIPAESALLGGLLLAMAQCVSAGKLSHCERQLHQQMLHFRHSTLLHDQPSKPAQYDAT
jgi:hypothetical protein